MEVLLVLAILVVIGSLAAAAYGPIHQKANRNAAKAEIESLETILRFYQADMDGYPTTQDGLEALREPPPEGAGSGKWRGPYLDGPIPLDPWGNPYQYEFPGRYAENKPDLWSLGPDGISGSDDDVGNWPEA